MIMTTSLFVLCSMFYVLCFMIITSLFVCLFVFDQIIDHTKLIQKIIFYKDQNSIKMFCIVEMKSILFLSITHSVPSKYESAIHLL